jgi:acyl-CoA thioesterase
MKSKKEYFIAEYADGKKVEYEVETYQDGKAFLSTVERTKDFVHTFEVDIDKISIAEYLKAQNAIQK